MIEDLEGATTEPSRRRHLVVLSAASAVISLALLVALVLPPSNVRGPESAAPAASQNASAFEVTFAGPGTTFARPDTRVTLTALLARPVASTGSLVCFVSSDGSASPLISVRPDVWWGELVYVGPDTPTTRSVPVPVVAPRGWLSVNCATSDGLEPWERVAR